MNSSSTFQNILSVINWAMVHPQLKAELAAEAYRQRLYAQITIWVSLPILLFYGIGDLFGEGGLYNAFPELLVAVILFFTGFAVRKMQSIQMLLRFPMAAVCILLLHDVYTAPGEGSDLLWMTTVPLFAFAVFGRTEGLIWSTAVIAVSLTIVFAPFIWGAYEYKDSMPSRYAIVIILVSTLSYAGESMRFSFYQKIQLQKQQLEAALNDIKTLRGLLPICAHCKKIRDDKGYWRHLESYLSQHTDAQFSHGICVTCLREIDPVVYQEMLAEGLIRESQGAESPYR